MLSLVPLYAGNDATHALLDVNCIVYELPAEADSERVLAALARDSRVKSAQPLVDFTVEARSPERTAGTPQD